jgi:hypothetical protein
MIALAGCGGKLSDEQRKEMRDGMKEQTIQRVSDAQLTEAAFKLGREIMGKAIRQDSMVNIDSIELNRHVRIHWLTAGSANALEIERQIIDAYVMNAATGNDQPDNVQLVGEDSILYTKPVVEPMPDGAIYVKGTWNVWMSRKELVLSLNSDN